MARLKQMISSTKWLPGSSSLSEPGARPAQLASRQWDIHFCCFLDEPGDWISIAAVGRGTLDPGAGTEPRDTTVAPLGYAAASARYSLTPAATPSELRRNVRLSATSPANARSGDMVGDRVDVEIALRATETGDIRFFGEVPRDGASRVLDLSESDACGTTESMSVLGGAVYNESDSSTRSATWRYERVEVPGTQRFARTTQRLAFAAGWQVTANFIRSLPGNKLSFGFTDSAEFHLMGQPLEVATADWLTRDEGDAEPVRRLNWAYQHRIDFSKLLRDSPGSRAD